ncbi:MAG TPA: pyridoxine 5'-phosphate synthase [Acidobacteriota bacterium]|nr:pyridoxine 5'-phosphate synthase [Acidobacteriota bacterium]
MTKLGVNIDHIATIRQARGAVEPDPVAAAVLAELAGADGITVHLRSDRRHILDRDVRVLRETVTTRLNIEMAVTNEMIGLALKYKPDTVTLVPERPEEITTEGGLDVAGSVEEIRVAVEKLNGAGIEVSLFIDPEETQLMGAVETGAPLIELNTAAYSEAVPKGLKDHDPHFLSELGKITSSASLGEKVGLRVLAGHGLTYRNVFPISAIPQVEELNIGHNIIARAALVGMKCAVSEMLLAMNPEGRA